MSEQTPGHTEGQGSLCAAAHGAGQSQIRPSDWTATTNIQSLTWRCYWHIWLKWDHMTTVLIMLDIVRKQRWRSRMGPCWRGLTATRDWRVAAASLDIWAECQERRSAQPQAPGASSPASPTGWMLRGDLPILLATRWTMVLFVHFVFFWRLPLSQASFKQSYVEFGLLLRRKAQVNYPSSEKGSASSGPPPAIGMSRHAEHSHIFVEWA